MVRLFLAVRALDSGGAERQLLELAKAIDKTSFDVHVVALRPGLLDHEARAADGVTLHILGKRRRYDPRFLARYVSLLDALRPHVVYAFMFDLNVYSAIARRLARGQPRLVWGIFGSEPDFSRGPKFIRSLFFMLKRLERTADLILSDSVRGLEFLRKYGFRLRRSQVIFSGTDTVRFDRHPQDRQEFRVREGLQSDDIAVGICSRLSRMKGYPVLAEAARSLLRAHPRLRFYAAGHGDDVIRAECTEILGDMSPRFTWLGRVAEPARVMSGWDVYCSSSIYGEGFSNAIIEAMACRLPCVVTDVGDARIQVNDTGIVVPPGNAGELRAALEGMIRSQELQTLGARARARVCEHFTAERMARQTEAALMRLLRDSRPHSERGRPAQPSVGMIAPDAQGCGTEAQDPPQQHSHQRGSRWARAGSGLVGGSPSIPGLRRRLDEPLRHC